MQEIIARACMLVAIILLGYVLRRIRFLPEEAFAVVSKTVLNVTLPCAVITNFAHIQVTPALLWMFPLGFLVNALLVGTGYLTGKRRGMDEQVFCMLNLSGHNIGCFALPYVASLLGPTAVVSVCLFDAGNAIWATGGTNALCAAMQEGGRIRLGERPQALVRRGLSPTIARPERRRERVAQPRRIRRDDRPTPGDRPQQILRINLENIANKRETVK